MKGLPFVVSFMFFFFRLWDLAKTSKNVFEASSEEEPEIVKTNEDSGTEEDIVFLFTLVNGGWMWMSFEYRYAYVCLYVYSEYKKR